VTTTRLAPAPTEADARAGRRAAFGLTPRGLLLLAAGLVFVGPAWIDRRALVLLVLWDAFVIGLVLFDLRRLPPPTRLRVSRRWGGPLALGTPTTVVVAVRNGGSIDIDLRLSDYVSGALRPDPPELAIAVPARGIGRVEYPVTPRERGDALMGGVVLQWRGAWGLVERSGIAPLEQTARVFPNLQEGRREALYLIRSRQISIEKRRARRIGAGREFDNLRDYRPGDERRDVCWSASARRGKLVTKVYQPERSQAVWLLVDAGRLLRARIGRQTMLDQTVTAALTLAQVVLASGDRVGLLAYAQKRRALVVWLTDVADTAGVPDVIEQALRMSPAHVVLFGVMRQPEIAALAAASPGSPTDMFRVMAAQETLERRESLLHGLRQRGALVLEVSPAELSSGLVDRYLEVKERGLL